MRWKNRVQQIALLQKQHKGERYKTPLPNLKMEQKCAPLGNKFAKVTGKRPPIVGAKEFPVGSVHKSNPMLITPGMIDNGELKYLGGRKF